MKNIKILLLVILMQFTLQCKAQSPIVALYRGDYSIENSYRKDLNSDLNKFVGTWRYINNDTILIVKLRKKVMHFTNFPMVKKYYSDILVGEYQLTVNGNEIANSLSRLDANFTNKYDYTICGYGLTKPCRICPTDKREVTGKFTEQDRKHIRNGAVQIRHVNQGLLEFIRLDFYSQGIESEFAGDPTEPWANKFNYGTYLMEKI